MSRLDLDRIDLPVASTATRFKLLV